VEWSKAIPDFQIEGPSEHVFWVKKALVKAGIVSFERTLLVETPFALRMGDQSFASIEAFVSWRLQQSV
jgi:hypothetical protein